MIKLLAFLLILWAGLVFGVSFIATPVKFMAKSLTMPVAMDVGRATFHVFNKVEWVFFAGILLATFLNTVSLRHLLCVAVIGVILCFETFYLLKGLDVRAMRIMAGVVAEPSILHWFYVAADVIKIIILLISGWYVLCQKIHN